MRILPDKLYLRRGEVREYLGLSEQAMSKQIRAGALTPVYLPNMTWAFYERGQVERFKAQESPRTQESQTNNKEMK